MRIFTLSLLCLLLSIRGQSFPVHSVTPDAATTSTISLEDIRDLKNKELGKKLGRRLSLRESLTFSLIRGKLKRAAKKAKKHGKGMQETTVADVGMYSFFGGALAAGIASAISAPALLYVALLGCLLAVILGAIGMKKFKANNPDKYRIAKTAFWLGLSTMLVAILGLMLISIIFSNLFN
ncbi:hypothetical protein [Flavilitoribacter nigricans]|uniref:DUF4190 domain-containing protein n=1 Tax=Flavilitoribacter nigricans (strain ATCC 23147 / DSM 23189 / NBRC 102662 / NCIMB 1420 / SS-2) TaxID=1122177 RepID=A0A2D0N0T0_FLAN2|nr:hypothetical protein [Flavilitoribacter nigricans]PHN02067.1 hypothetical protein CRP01_34100 [Flavilitoribacter nigricans DSM 23189 = NBRC 102662]